MTKTMKRFHNDFVIERFIKEESKPKTAISDVLRKEQAILKEIKESDLEVTNSVLRKLIERAKLSLSIAADKEHYGMQLDGLYISQGYVNDLLLAYREVKA